MMKEEPVDALNQILNRLSDYNYIKYVAYRTSSKIRMLQKAFFLDSLPVEVISGVLNQHHLTTTENAVRLTTSELCNLLEDVYFVVSREHLHGINCDQSVNILCRFFLNILQKHTGIELLSVKVILTVLCGSKPRDKYNYLFSQLSDHNSVLTSRRLELLLQRLVLITEFVGEGGSFGRTLVPGTVQSCFENLAGGSLGITFEGFTAWLGRDPQLLVWLSTLHRLNLSDALVHDVKCSVCKVAPLHGLRYRCLRCLAYNQCQNCFFSGKTSKNHKKSHPVQEYCYRSTAKQSLTALLATLKNKLKRSGLKLQYLPVEQRQSYLEETTLQLDQLHESTKTLSQSSCLSMTELENIILELEKQSEKLRDGMKGIKASDVKEMLDNHRILVENQVCRLRNLKGKLSREQRRHKFVNSTPCSRLSRRAQPIQALSPITSNSLALTWDKYDIDAADEGPCVLTYEDDSGSSLSDGGLPPVSSHAYTWLQSTTGELKTDTFAVPNADSVQKIAEPDRPEDIQALHNDLDQILERLQELLSSTVAGNTNANNKLKSVEPDKILNDVLELL